MTKDEAKAMVGMGPLAPSAIVRYRGVEIKQNPLTNNWLFNVSQAGTYATTLPRCKKMIDRAVELGLIDGSKEGDYDTRK